MGVKYNIKYLPLFYKDLNNIIAYIKFHLNNEMAANAFVDKLEKKIQKRAFNPISFEEYKSSKKRKNKYYRIYLYNYTVFYTVNKNTIEIRRILYSRRNFNSLM